ncbi:glycosyltransferase family 2 protein [Patescibacteria group bacterium]|nr:glycosyltransferase family 2 protein [Patescibacteria group bacterium]
MKLIVTIPAYNEEKTIAAVIKEIPRQLTGIDAVQVLVIDDGSRDQTVAVAKGAGADFVISNNENKGLAYTFRRALEEALAREADVIVNTDADNHYDQSRLAELIKPILDKQADIVIGSREVKKLAAMPASNKYGNLFGSWLVCKLANLPRVDVSSGFRAYSREAALKLNVFSLYTYTHETLIQARERQLKIIEVPIKARPVRRPSRLIRNIPFHVTRSVSVILRVLTLYNFLRMLLVSGLVLFVVGLIPLIRFFYFFVVGQSEGHIQSLVVGTMIVLIGFITVVMALLVSAIDWNRKLIEDTLYRLKKIEKQ